MNNVKILFLSEQNPFKRVTGVKVTIYNRLLCLSQVGELTCVYPYRFDEDIEPDEEEVVTLAAKFYFIEKTQTNNWLLNKLSIYLGNTFGRLFLQRSIKKKIEKIVLETSPDVIWLEYGFIAHLIPLFKEKQLPVIFVTHNAEAKLYYDKWKSENSLIYKVLLLPYIAAFFLQEKFYLKKADRIVTITENDRTYYARYLDEKKIDILPIILDENEFDSKPAFKASHDYICMVGSMDSFQNYNGMIYFINDIWPMVRDKYPDLRLYLIGRLPKENSERYNSLMKLTIKENNIILTGVVDDTVPYVKGALMSVVPILEGGGMRTKIVESTACRTPVVSTTKGAEGLSFRDGKSIMIGDTPKEFVGKIARLMSDEQLKRKIVENAYLIYKQEQGREAGLNKMREIIKKALNA